MAPRFQVTTGPGKRWAQRRGARPTEAKTPSSAAFAGTDDKIHGLNLSVRKLRRHAANSSAHSGSTELMVAGMVSGKPDVRSSGCSLPECVGEEFSRDGETSRSDSSRDCCDCRLHRICIKFLTEGFFDCRFTDGTPVLAKDFSQSCVEGPRMLPSR